MFARFVLTLFALLMLCGCPGRKETLSGGGAVNPIAAELDAGGVRYSLSDGDYLWEAVRPLISFMQAFIKMAFEEESDLPENVNVMGLVDAAPGLFGLNQIQGIGESTIRTESGYQSRFVIHKKSGADGLPWTQFGAPFSVRKELAALPPTTAIAFRTSLDLVAIKAFVRKVTGILGVPMDFADEMFAEAQEEGVPLQGILNAFSGGVTVAISLDSARQWPIPLPTGQPLFVPAPGLVLMLDVKNDLLLTTLLENLKESPVPPQAITVEGQAGHMIPIPAPVPTPIALCFANVDGRFVFATSEELFKQTVAGLKGKGTGAMALLDAWKGDLPDSAVSFYVANGVLGEQVRKAVAQFEPMMAAQPAMKPVVDLYMGFLDYYHVCAINEATPNGFRATLHHKMALGESGAATMMAAPATVGLLAAIAVPAFQKAREAAQRNACINNLRQINGANQMYMIENRVDVLPALDDPKLHEYFQAGELPTCPLGGTYIQAESASDVPSCSMSHKGHTLLW